MQKPHGINLSPAQEQMLSKFLNEDQVKNDLMTLADQFNEFGRVFEKLADSCRKAAGNFDDCDVVSETALLAAEIKFTRRHYLMCLGLLNHHNLIHHHSDAYSTMQEQLETVLPRTLQVHEQLLDACSSEMVKEAIARLTGEL